MDASSKVSTTHKVIDSEMILQETNLDRILETVLSPPHRVVIKSYQTIISWTIWIDNMDPF